MPRVAQGAAGRPPRGAWAMCRAQGCRHASTHLTAAHLCGRCGRFGHGQIECGNTQRILALASPADDGATTTRSTLSSGVYEAMPHTLQCRVRGCPWPHTHHTQAHHCTSCLKRLGSRHHPRCVLDRGIVGTEGLLVSAPSLAPLQSPLPPQSPPFSPSLLRAPPTLTDIGPDSPSSYGAGGRGAAVAISDHDSERDGAEEEEEGGAVVNAVDVDASGGSAFGSALGTEVEAASMLVSLRSAPGSSSSSLLPLPSASMRRDALPTATTATAAASSSAQPPLSRRVSVLACPMCREHSIVDTEEHVVYLPSASECIVCLSDKPLVLFRTCRHACMCAQCCERMGELRRSEDAASHDSDSDGELTTVV